MDVKEMKVGDVPVCEAVPKVARIQHERILARLNHIRRNLHTPSLSSQHQSQLTTPTQQHKLT